MTEYSAGVAWRDRYAPNLLGSSDKLLTACETASRVASADCSVLIQGESGTGKELLARAIHASSPRAAKPFVTVNCAAIPEALVEAELFGHVKGAFTGAISARPGSFVLANRGTLFFDEIGDLPLSQQAKLLRALQEKEVTALGSGTARTVDVRVLAATHRDLAGMVRRGTFRADLYYRVHVVPLALPPLRERAKDIAPLAQTFVEKFASQHSRSVEGFTSEALRVLQSLGWPGNVRELENLVERLVLLASDRLISAADIPDTGALHPHPMDLPENGLNTRVELERIENEWIRQALTRTGWNRAHAARLLGINRTTLVEKLKSKSFLGNARGDHIADAAE